MKPIEVAFKIVFFLAILVFCLSIIGVFLIFIKISFLFTPDFVFLGIKFSPALAQPIYQ